MSFGLDALVVLQRALLVGLAGLGVVGRGVADFIGAAAAFELARGRAHAVLVFGLVAVIVAAVGAGVAHDESSVAQSMPAIDMPGACRNLACLSSMNPFQ